MKKVLIILLIVSSSCKTQHINKAYLPEQAKKEDLKKDQQIGFTISGVGILFFLILFY